MKDFPQLSLNQESQLTDSLLHWSLSNGLVMYPPNFKSYGASSAPITLFPTPFPKQAFSNANDVQVLFNELYINLVTKHKVWLVDILKDLSTFDADFTGKLFETYLKALEQSPGGKFIQPLSLGLFRSDYMIDSRGDVPEIKQIEFNTVSVSFGGLSTKVGQLHNYLNKTGLYDNTYSFPYYSEEEVPVSDSINLLASGLAEADSKYREAQEEPAATTVLFVVQANERNCFDQRHIEYSLLNNHGIRSVRVSLENIQSQLTQTNNKLYIKETMDEISVVYYRSGYSPSDYESNPELTWSARLFLETSAAIKCPSLLTQLSGAKKIQQILTSPEYIQKFLALIAEDDLKKLLSTFVTIYPLDNSPQGKLAKKLAFEEPERFVLKPQREGGGNNIYKENIPAFLQNLKEEEWDAYILMELIDAPTHKNKIIRNDEIYNEDIISELGIFGTILFSEETGVVISNKNAGWLLRSKFSSSNEGGVAAGFGCVDNVYLY